MNILLIGEECEDIFSYGRCTRLNPEAPTPVFIPTKTKSVRGMAANVYENLKNLIDPSDFVSFIKQEGVQITKCRFVDEASNYILLRVDSEEGVRPLELTEELKELISAADCVVVSDYNKGFLSTQVLEEIGRLAALSFIDTKKEFGEWIEDFTWIKVNRKEFANPLHEPVTQARVYDKTIITLSENGASLGSTTIKPLEVPQVVDVCGAGDTFLAGLVAEYLRTQDIISAIHFANLCAGQAVSQRGVVAVTSSYK
jgi:D-beta-D-heptose 7-phosphate kinase/D-beta-D-heptose 1-phosphate adenosyltransferase